MKILIVDDSKTSCLLLANQLKTLGHSPVYQCDGTKALESFIEHQPDIVLMDVVLSNISGHQCAQQITDYNQHSDDWVPIIFISAVSTKHSIIDAINAGGDDYLTKPVSNELLQAKIKVMERIATMRKRLIDANRALQSLSETDTLTGIANRSHFEMVLSKSIEACTNKNTELAVLFLDLDKFKTINDTLGHTIGDALLVQVANRINHEIRPCDFLARLGGDEFAVVLTQIKSLEFAGDLANRLIRTISQPFVVNQHNILVTTSIGIACYPKAGTRTDQLIKHADIAMYRAKALGRNIHQYFSEELNQSYAQRLQLEQALSLAISRNEFTLAFQPKYKLNPKSLTGFEILIRWQNPELGNVPPDTFIPIAEESGLIKPIGEWVIKHACKALSELQVEYNDKIHFAINVSPLQLMEDSMLDLLKSTINYYQLQTHQIEIEITETAIMANTNAIERALNDLHNMGIHIDIDDFGTGFSSLSHIKRLPIDGLKIDKEFVMDIPDDENDAAIVRSIIHFAKSLNLNITAEGVESQSQVEYLIQNGCDHGQGYFLGKPLNFNETLRLIQKH